jgi:hypothetical protein
VIPKQEQMPNRKVNRQVETKKVINLRCLIGVSSY